MTHEEKTDDKGDEELTKLTNDLYINLEIKDRKWLLSTYPKCFVGSEAVEYLVKQKKCQTREEGVNLLSKKKL